MEMYRTELHLRRRRSSNPPCGTPVPQFTMCTHRFVFGALALLLSWPLSSYSQPSPRPVLRVGLDLQTAFEKETGSFTRDPGFAFSFLTGFRVYQRDELAVNTGIELSYNRLVDYRLNVTGTYQDEYTYRFVVDHKHTLAFIEFALLPELYYSFTDDMVVGIYAGGGIGIGAEHLTVNYKVNEVVDSTYVGGFSYGPYGEYNMNPGKFPTSLDVGGIVYWHNVVLDFRYKYTDMQDAGSIHRIFTSVFIFIGIAF